MNNFTLHIGDCLETLKTLPDCSVDSVITDPPYGLSQHTPQQVADCLGAWLRGEEYKPKGKGFMGKSWDAWVPSPVVWRECLRVLKPGGHLLAFAGTRSMDLMSMAVRLAGFELRDSIGYAHDGSDAVMAGFPNVKTGMCPAHASGTNTVYGDFSERKHCRPAMNGGDSGSAARFFYCAKTSKKDRDEGLGEFDKDTTDDGRNTPIDNPYLRGKTERANIHPTVKPTALMRYLCRLVTPPNGTVLDPFTGSGSTGKAAILEGFNFIGCEMQPEYHAIAKARIEAAFNHSTHSQTCETTITR